jgi:hypothetical protein
LLTGKMIDASTAAAHGLCGLARMAADGEERRVGHPPRIGRS